MQEGDVFAGRYEVRAVLGRGGMGGVYRAHDTALGRDVALKVMAAWISRDPVFRGRFRREASAAAGIESPHVVRVWHADEHEGELYVVMQLVDGTDLAHRLREQGPLTPEETAAVVADVASALDAAHAAGVVHRDVKPANVLQTRDWTGREFCLLTDFGIARPMTAASDLTTTLQVLGTAPYMAPEQAQGLPLTGRCDVYALGCVAFACLTGSPPFSTGSALEIARRHVDEPPPDLDELVPGLPPGVAAAVATALAKDPDDRYPTAGAFAEALQAAVHRAPEHTAVLPTVAAGRRRGPARRRRLVAVTAATALLLAGALGALISGGAAGLPGTAGSGEAGGVLAAAGDRPAVELPGEVFRDCQEHPDALGPGRTAALRCEPAQPGGADEVLAVAWESPEAMRADFAASYEARRATGPCASGWDRASSWLRDGERAGGLACYHNRQGAAVVMWEHDDLAVQLLAVRADGRTAPLFTWWDEARRTPLEAQS
jgi:hypothetical protein